jgi:hypothetical protein
MEGTETPHLNKRKEIMNYWNYDGSCKITSLLVSNLGRSPTEATQLRFDQKKSSLLVEPSVCNGASPTSVTTMR